MGEGDNNLPLFSEQVEEFLISALRANIKEDEFWEMTPKEIKNAIKALSWRLEQERKQTANFIYTLSQLTASAVGMQFSKSHSKFPKLYEVFPQLFENELQEEVAQKQKTNASVARFLQFANSFNQNFKSEVNE